MRINRGLWNILKALTLAILLASAGGCAMWSRVDNTNALIDGANGKFKVQAPVGWVRFNLARDSVMITKDGLPIQHIAVSQQTDEEYFKQTKVKLPGVVLPSDLAQMVLAEMRSQKLLANLAVKENVPYTVAGLPGFKVHFQYRDDRGTLFDRVVLGTSKGKEVITIVYHGLNTYYFDRDLNVFYDVAKSFRS